MDLTSQGIPIPSKEAAPGSGLLPELRAEALAINTLFDGVDSDIAALPATIADHAAENDRDLLATPLGVSGCIIWAEAGYITGAVDGNALSAWTNLATGGATIAQANATYQPIYHLTNGVPYVSNVFAGGFDLTLPATDTGLMTVFLVMRSGVNSPVTDKVVMNLGGGTKYAVQESGGQIVAQDAFGTGGNHYYSGHLASNKWKVFAFRGNKNNTDDLGSGLTSIANGNSTFRTQGSSGSSWIGSTVTSGFLGGLGAGAGDYWTGDFRGVLVYNRVLTDAETFRVLSYLHRRFAITYDAPTENLILDGDSQTVSFTGAIVAGTGLSDTFLSTRTKFRAFNLGVTGQTLAQALADAPTQVDTRIDRSLANNTVMIFAGTNDLVLPGATAAAIYADTVAYCLGRRAAGLKVIVATTLPRGSNPVWEAIRISLNALIRANWATFADAIADYGADASIGVPGSQTNPILFQASDQTHLTPAGYTVGAGILTISVTTLYSQPAPAYVDSLPDTVVDRKPKVLPADATALISNTLTAIPGLSRDVVIGAVYSFTVRLWVTDSAGEGLKVDMNGGTAGMSWFRATYTGLDDTFARIAQSAALSTAIDSDSFSGLIEVRGSFSPSSSGTFIPRAAQKAHVSGSLTVLKGSSNWVQESAT